jgi:hypothetical protein
MDVQALSTAEVLSRGLIPAIRQVHRRCFPDPLLDTASDAEFIEWSAFCHEPQHCTWLLLLLTEQGEQQRRAAPRRAAPRRAAPRRAPAQQQQQPRGLNAAAAACLQHTGGSSGAPPSADARPRR